MRAPADAGQVGDRLKSRRALVTGAGAGIGRACAMMFARQGAAVVGLDLEAGRLAALRDESAQAKLNVSVLAPVDLTDAAAAGRAVTQAAAALGGLDILVNAAATAVFKPIEQLSYAEWRATLAAEIDSVFLVCQAAWPHLKKQGGAVVNFASVNAYMALEGSDALAHCAGKGGVLAMTRQLAMEGGPFGVRANTISPGFIVTAATQAHLQAVPELADKVLSKKMLKRVGQPEDVAFLATFLVSDEASWITASDFAVDGGARAW